MEAEPVFLSDSVLIQRAPDALWRRVGSEVVSAKGGREGIELLSPTAGAIWMLLDEPRTFADLLSSLAGAYRVGQEEIELDVRGFLSSLMERELVQAVADGDD